MAAKVSERRGWNSEQLTFQESKQLLIGPAITTVTFMRGSATTASPVLKQRLELILSANPWLCGRLTKGVKLEYPSGTSSSHPLSDYYIESDPELNINSDMDYISICGAIAKKRSEVPSGNKCVNKNKPLIALTIAPDSKEPNDGFAVILSISHVIIDGFNYYQILNMLNPDSEILSLSCKRKHSIIEGNKQAMGGQEHAWANSTAVICNVLGNMMCGSKAIVRCYEVSDQKVKREKDNAAAHANGGFVSTNDVITSMFANAVSSDVLLMPVNFRNKLPEYNDNDAGNYEGALVFAGSGEYGNPANIRNTLKSGPPTFLRGADKAGNLPKGSAPLPAGFFATKNCKLGMCTNWAFSTFQELKLPSCEQVIHLPHTDCKMIPFDICVVFRPKANKLAAAFFVRNIDQKGLEVELPVGLEMSSPGQYHRETTEA